MIATTVEGRLLLTKLCSYTLALSRLVTTVTRKRIEATFLCSLILTSSVEQIRLTCKVSDRLKNYNGLHGRKRTTRNQVIVHNSSKAAAL